MRVAREERRGHHLRVRVKVCPKCSAQFDGAATFCQVDGARLELSGVSNEIAGTVLLGQFQVEEAVGAGGMGVVYRAYQAELDRHVAIKVLHPELVKNRDAVRRFQREAKVATALNHPNLVRVFLFGQLDDGSLYLVMEFLDGVPLTRLVHERPLSLERALHITAQVCDGVGTAHAQGIVHRDVKPENILIVERRGDPDFVKVLDFGVARLLWGDQSAMTQSGVIFGTARYISPEGAAGEPTDARSDVYSIGVMLYQLLVGHTPFHGDTPVALLMKHINTAPPNIRDEADVPEALAALIMRCLDKNPQARPDDASALATELREIAKTLDIRVREPHQASTTSGSIELSRAIQERAESVPPAKPRSEASESQARAPTKPRRDAIDSRTRIDGLREPSQRIMTARRSSRELMDDVGRDHTERTRRREHERASRLDASRSRVDPYAATGSTYVGVPGMRKRRWPGLLVAFLLGVSVVCAVAWFAGVRPPGFEKPTVALFARAKAALDRDALTAPAGDNVAELTDQVLSIEPNHSDAQALRREAVLRLRERAANARESGARPEARALYEQVVVFVPGDPAAQTALAQLADPEPAAVPTPVVTLLPEAPRVRQAVSFRATVPEAATEGTFQIWKNGEPVRRLTGQRVGDAYTASYTFTQTGAYTVTFESPTSPTVTAELSVAAARRRRRAPPPTTTQVGSTRMIPVRNANRDDGIDWSIPETMGGSGTRMTTMTTRQPPPPPPPPAPWTGGSGGVL